MNALIFTRSGETVQEGRIIPEAEVVRDDPQAAVTMQVREAKTVRLGPRRRGPRRRGEAEASDPGQVFQVREAATVTEPPSHWAQLTKQEETDHVHESGSDADRGETGIG